MSANYYIDFLQNIITILGEVFVKKIMELEFVIF